MRYFSWDLQICPAGSLPSIFDDGTMLQMISDSFDLDNMWNLDKLYLIISPTLKLIKEIKGDPQRWKGIPRSGTGRIITVKMATLPKTAYRFNVLLLFRTLSHIQLLHPHGPQPASLLCLWDSPGKNTRVGYHFLLQEIFQLRDWTCISCIGRQILYPWATSEAWVLSCSVMSDSLWPHGL